MTKKTSTSVTPESIVGITPRCLYVLSTSNVSLALQHTGQHHDRLQLQWLENRETFFFQGLRECNLLLNADFGNCPDHNIFGWEGEAHGLAAIGADFSDKWRLAGGHTAYLFAPAGSPRPVLRLVEAIPLVSDLADDTAFNYRLSGFFGTHRADGIITIDFFDADDKKLCSKTFRIPESDKHLGGLLPENYHYMQWDVRPAPNSTQARLQISLGSHTGGSSPDSFLFVSHLFFGVADTADPSIWTPFSAGAHQLSRYAQNHAWRAFGIAALPKVNDQQNIAISFGNKKYSLIPENAAIPDYLSAAVINTSAQNINKLFDPGFYAQTDHNTLDSSDSDGLLKHYQTTGWRINRSPSPYFDVAWYLVNNQDVREQTIEPLQHFVDTGSAAHRSPHPLFHAQWYYQTYLAGDQPTAQPLFHYLSVGWQQGNQPHPLFWTCWYEKKYLGKSAGRIDPFYHFLTEGWRNGCNPNPLFDTAYYLKQHATKNRIEPDPLSHYCHVGWRENFQPHSLFDPTYYAMQTGFNVQLATHSPLEEFLTTSLASSSPVGWAGGFAHPLRITRWAEQRCPPYTAVSPHPLFDAEFYRGQVGCELEQHPLLDYLARGWQGRIDPNPLFSKSFYFSHAQDAVKGQIDALIHYLESGWKKNLPVHPLFNAQFYLEQNPKAKGCIPLQHYLMHGWHNGYSCRPADESLDISPPKKLPETRITLRIPNDRLLPPLTPVETVEPPRIGVFAHIFYPDLAAEMIAATNNIPGNCTLFISTNTLVKLREITDVCKKQSKHPFEIRTTPNRGRDIATMVCGFRDRLQEVDYGVHIHSKRSSHFNAEFADAWRQHLIEGNLGTEALVSNILLLLSDDRIGAYAPDHYEPLRPLIQWTGNFSTVKKLLEMCGEDLSKEHSLDFPSGSMFWFKTKALKPLLDLNLRPYHFEAENGQTDNTLAHAIERSFFYFVEMSGYAWIVGQSVSGIAAERAIANMETAKFSIGNVANRLFPTNRELGGLRRHFSHCTRFLARPSLIQKPRLNLLVPTLNNVQRHTDTATALELFAAIRSVLGADVDARIITTDVSPEHQYHPPKGYQTLSTLEKDQLDVDVVVDAAQRFRYPFFVRDTDIFMATAWWTAFNALDLLKQQDRLFGQRLRSFVYFIQDIEFSFYPWSSQFALAEQTYRHPDKIIPVFNTNLVFDYFCSNGYFNNGHIAYPPMNPTFKKAISYGTPKEKIVLLHTRPQVERHGLPFLDVLVQTVIDSDPVFWSEWQFLAIGDAINSNTFKTCPAIEILGQLPTQHYAELASRAALAISLMISPNPSFPSLEMAAAGVLVLTNGFTSKNLSLIHDNISSFELFDIDSVAGHFRQMADEWTAQQDMGWHGKPGVDWFYGETNHLHEVGAAIAGQISAMLFS
ncbi:MAG: rhamnan synthesis F family protein [Methylovulum sp.]|nr:rhamnan synthesis F family protein [Methylovulum sp.]